MLIVGTLWILCYYVLLTDGGPLIQTAVFCFVFLYAALSPCMHCEVFQMFNLMCTETGGIRGHHQAAEDS